MFEGYYDRGFVSTESEVEHLTKLLGQAPRSYELRRRNSRSMEGGTRAQALELTQHRGGSYGDGWNPDVSSLAK